MPNTAADTSPDQLRAQMVDHILSIRRISARVEAALREVPRHLFVPEATAAEAYAEQAVITKRAASGDALSCASVPSLVATMLDQLDVQPGHRVLEIGAGTGYNAALLAHLVGPTGHVTTVDIDPEVTSGARAALNVTGNRRVHVITRDGALGAAEHAPYDRIIVTVGAWDIPPAWWDQLGIDGRLIVPLRWRGQTRSIGFGEHGDRLESDTVELCGFVPMIGQDGEHTATIDPASTVTIAWDQDQPIDASALRGVLDQPKTTIWTGATVVANEPFDGIWLRLTADIHTCRITAESATVESGLCTPAISARSPALADDHSLAYLTIRRVETEPERRWELGATGHGPNGRQLATRLCDAITTWNTNRAAIPVITAHRTTVLAEPGESGVVVKPHSRLKIAY